MMQHDTPASAAITWDCAFDVHAAAASMESRQRDERRYIRATVAAFILFTMAFAVLFTPFVLQQRESMKQSSVADAASSHVMGWPSGKAERMFAQARAYNRRLAASGQPVIGEASDPYGLVTPTAVDTKGSNSLTVENVHSIAQLPLTGGAGLAFMVVIAALLGTAGVIVVVRSRRHTTV
jgi:LPXTG-motif cell wall-anchored protein